MTPTKLINVRATPEQIAEIDRRAKAAGLTRSGYLLDRALSNALPPSRARQRVSTDAASSDPAHVHTKACRRALPYGTICSETGRLIR